jgi:hypothetical protein
MGNKKKTQKKNNNSQNKDNDNDKQTLDGEIVDNPEAEIQVTNEADLINTENMNYMQQNKLENTLENKISIPETRGDSNIFEAETNSSEVTGQEIYEKNQQEKNSYEKLSKIIYDDEINTNKNESFNKVNTELGKNAKDGIKSKDLNGFGEKSNNILTNEEDNLTFDLKWKNTTEDVGKEKNRLYPCNNITLIFR